jgi:hypothetical protein
MEVDERVTCRTVGLLGRGPQAFGEQRRDTQLSSRKWLAMRAHAGIVS